MKAIFMLIFLGFSIYVMKEIYEYAIELNPNEEETKDEVLIDKTDLNKKE